MRQDPALNFLEEDGVILGSASNPTILIVSLSSLVCIVITVALCTCCCCKKKLTKEEEEDYYTTVGYKVVDKNHPNVAVISGKDKQRPHFGKEKDPTSNRPLLGQGAGGQQGGNSNNMNSSSLLRALPSLPSVPPQPVYPDNGHTSALVHSSKELKDTPSPGSLTRESSTSELYATVDKPAPPTTKSNKHKQPLAKHLYAKIRRKPDSNRKDNEENTSLTYDTVGPDPLYSKVKDPPSKGGHSGASGGHFDSQAKEKEANVQLRKQEKERQYEYPTFPGRQTGNNEGERGLSGVGGGARGGSVDPKYARVEGPYSVVESEDPYSSIKSDAGVPQKPGKHPDSERIYGPPSSTTSSSDDPYTSDPRYARIHKDRRSVPIMGPLGEEPMGVIAGDGRPVPPNRLEDELAVDYLYAKVRRRHSDSTTGQPQVLVRLLAGGAPPGLPREQRRPPLGITNQPTGIMAHEIGAISPTEQARREFFGRGEPISTPAPGTSRTPVATPGPSEPGGSRLGVQQRQQGQGYGHPRGSVGGSSDGGGPSYKYITVRESAETLRARMAAQQRVQEEEERTRTHSDPSLHYYSTIGSENSYEVVTDVSSSTGNQQGMYEQVPDNPQSSANQRPSSQSRGTGGTITGLVANQIAARESQGATTNPNVTMVEIDSSDSMVISGSSQNRAFSTPPTGVKHVTRGPQRSGQNQFPTDSDDSGQKTTTFDSFRLKTKGNFDNFRSKTLDFDENLPPQPPTSPIPSVSPILTPPGGSGNKQKTPESFGSGVRPLGSTPKAVLPKTENFGTRIDENRHKIIEIGLSDEGTSVRSFVDNRKSWEMSTRENLEPTDPDRSKNDRILSESQEEMVLSADFESEKSSLSLSGHSTSLQQSTASISREDLTTTELDGKRSASRSPEKFSARKMDSCSIPESISLTAMESKSDRLRYSTEKYSGRKQSPDKISSRGRSPEKVSLGGNARDRGSWEDKLAERSFFTEKVFVEKSATKSSWSGSPERILTEVVETGSGGFDRGSPYRAQSAKKVDSRRRSPGGSPKKSGFAEKAGGQKDGRSSTTVEANSSALYREMSPHKSQMGTGSGRNSPQKKGMSTNSKSAAENSSSSEFLVEKRVAGGFRPIFETSSMVSEDEVKGGRKSERIQSPVRTATGRGSPAKGLREVSVSQLISGKPDEIWKGPPNPSSVFDLQNISVASSSLPASPQKKEPDLAKLTSSGIAQSRSAGNSAPQSRSDSPMKEAKSPMLAENQRPENLGSLASACDKNGGIPLMKKTEGGEGKLPENAKKDGKSTKNEVNNAGKSSKSAENDEKSAGQFGSAADSGKGGRGLSGDGDDHANCFCHARRPNPEAVIKENISVMEKFGRRDSSEDKRASEKQGGGGMSDILGIGSSRNSAEGSAQKSSSAYRL